MRHFAPRFAALALLGLAAAAPAQAPLAEVIPADALVYIGWQGTDALGPTYANSNMKGVVDALNVQAVLDAALKQAGLEAAKDPKKLANLTLATSLGSDLLRYPAAFYFGGVDLTTQKPTPRLALLVKSGKEKAAALALDLTQAIAQNRQPGSPPAVAKAAGDYLVITLGNPTSLAPLLTGTADATFQPLTAKKEFLAASAQTQKDPAVVVFVNAAEVLKLADDAVALKANDRVKDMFPKVMDVLGLDGVKYAIMTGGFDGRDWAGQSFIALKERRNGLLQFLDNKPLSEDALKRIPKAATFAGAIRLDGDRFVTDLREAAGRIDDNAQARIDAAIQASTQLTGVDIQKDLLATLGDEWLYYGTTNPDPKAASSLTLVNKLRDPATAERALTDLELFIAGIVAQRGNDNVNFATEKAGELNVHIISWKTGGGGSVAWAIHNGILYFSLSPQGVQAAVDHITKKSPNLTENPAFIALRAKLGVPKASAFSFSDLSQSAPQYYAQIVALVAKAQQDHPDAKIKITLPAYEKLSPFMTATGSVTWTDADGWHSKSYGPFLGSSMAGGLPTLIQSLAAKAAQTNRVPTRSPPPLTLTLSLIELY